jgi:hypothetical protein
MRRREIEEVKRKKAEEAMEKRRRKLEEAKIRAEVVCVDYCSYYLYYM